MVSLPEVFASNSQISSALPKQLVVMFAGATGGMGEAALKTLFSCTVESRIYLFARSQSSAERVIAKCRQINPRGDYILVSVDLSFIKGTDRACAVVSKREDHVIFVVFIAGEIKLGIEDYPKVLHVNDPNLQIM
jgi:NADP-dependent 3-hydroxy acid dehydrogenase YdfG